MDNNNLVFLEKFDYYQFEHLVTSKGIRVVTATIFPYSDHFGYFYSSYNSIQKVDKVLNTIYNGSYVNGQKILGGIEEAIMLINESNLETVEFHITLPGYFTISMPLRIFVQFLNDFKSWLLDLESGKILGIIPDSKLDSWSCVPNEYVKDDWWEIKKQKELE
jgi:hypothetical protein